MHRVCYSHILPVLIQLSESMYRLPIGDIVSRKGQRGMIASCRDSAEASHVGHGEQQHPDRDTSKRFSRSPPLSERVMRR